MKYSVVDNAVIYLTQLCDGAAAVDGQGWNKFDARIGRSFAEQLTEGRALTYKQRKVVNRIIRKYKRQFPNWAEIEEALPHWVKEGEERQKAYQKKKQQQEQERAQLPRLDYDPATKTFTLQTLYDQRPIAKSIPRGRWNKEQKVWVYKEGEEVLQAIAQLTNDKKFGYMEVPAISRVLEYHKELEKRREKIQVANLIKQQEHDTIDIPLRTKPFDHQIKAMKIATTLDYSALLMEQGTGKTLAAIGAAAYRYLKGQVKRLLVVAPKSVLPEWARQFEEHTDIPYKAVALDMKGKKKKEIIDNWTDGEGINILTINYESTWRLEKELIKWKPDMVILDESQKIKNARAAQSKACKKIGAVAKYRMILTGTPVSQSPLDFFGQYQFLDPTIFGNSFVRFRDRYANMGGYGGYEILGYKNLEELAGKAHSIAYRVTKQEAVDLPEEVSQKLYFELDPKARKLYKQMEKESILTLGEGETVATPIVLTKLLRLQQISGGFLKSDETGEVHQVSSAKLDLLKETVEDLIEAGKKLVIFAKFIPEVEAISKHLAEQKVKHVTLTGSTKDRKKVINQFQNDEDTKVFIAQISTGGVGITLTAADTAIFYSTGYSLNDYEQAKARIHRIGQTKKVTYIHLIAQDTVDQEVVMALAEKRDLARLTVDELKNIIFQKEEQPMAKRAKKAASKKPAASLDQKLEELKEQIENGEEIEVQVGFQAEEVETEMDNISAEEEVKEPAKKNKKAAKGKSSKKGKKTEKEPKTAKKSEKKPVPKKKVIEEGEEFITVQDLADEIGLSASALRRKLRTSGLEKPLTGRWEWTPEHPDLEVIRSWGEE